MKKHSLFIRYLLPFFFLFSVKSYGQSVDVDHNTGAAQVSIPIYTVKWGDIVMPISVSHKGNGMRLKETEGLAGVGWHLVAGGAITREVRDLPDDLPTGWLFNGNGAKVNAFNIANDNNKATCADETADRNYLTTNFSNLLDAEPDIFSLSLPGISCKLIFDAGQVRTVPYQDIKVSYVTGARGIVSFKVVTDRGITYNFETREETRRHAKSPNSAGIQFFKNVYEKYKNVVIYGQKWHLTSVESSGHRMLLAYSESTSSAKSSTTPYEFYLGNSSTKVKQFEVEDYGNRFLLSAIYYGDSEPYYDDGVDQYYRANVSFIYEVNYATKMPYVTRINVLDKYWNFQYKDAGFNNQYVRKFLYRISGTGVGSKVSYEFDYNTLSKTANDNVDLKLPDYSSTSVDRWGYYNASSETTLNPQIYINSGNSAYDRFRSVSPSLLAPFYSNYLGGALRKVDSPSVILGTLKQVKTSNGGVTKIDYEPNNYYDPQAQENVDGGGVRVKATTSTDVYDNAAIRVLTYSYNNPSTGFSSGKPISLPVFAFLRPYTGSGTTAEKWRASVVRSEENLSQDNDGILYSHVTESILGQGYKRFVFENSGMHFDTSAAPDWSPVVINVAACSNGGELVNEKNTYPFVPALNFDFERGLIKEVSTYNENNQPVSKIEYSYLRKGSPVYVSGLRFESNNDIMAYAKYRSVTGISKVLSDEKTTIYDRSVNGSQQTQVNYYYESPQHHYVTRTDKLNSDGSINRTLTRYSKDYVASGALASDTAASALKKLGEGGLNVMVEKYNQLVRGGQAKTVSGELIRFSPAASSDIMANPLQRLSFFRGSGVDDFQPSSVNAGLFTYDNRYIAVLNHRSFDVNNLPVTTDNGKGISSGVFYDVATRFPSALFDRAAREEVVYSGFEVLDSYSLFNVDNPSLVRIKTEGRTGHGYTLVPAQGIYKDLRKKKGTGWYIFSIWLKSSAAGALQVQVLNSSNVGSTYSLPFTGTGEVWKYYTLRVPVSSAPDNFRLKLKTNVEVKIDDMLFYPGNASVNTVSYDPNNFARSSETDNNGISRYYSYDNWGRLTQVSDEQKNILLRKTYVEPGESNLFPPVISFSEPIQNAPISFIDAAFNPNQDGTKYSWNFGDGTPVVHSMNARGALTHAYTAVGNYTVTLTKSSPFYGTMTTTQVITVTIPPSVKVTGLGDMAISFWQGSSILYYFSDAEVAAGNIYVPTGVYMVRVGAFDPYSSSNPYGYTGVGYTAEGPNGSMPRRDCRPSTPGVNTNDFYLDLRGLDKIEFSLLYGGNCIGGVE